ncbi:MAG: hypothetical protein L3J03_04745, partial [Desulfobacterales bacterium]|nr:hypothetical protein [Desulfobacterales bacterium]
SPPRRSEFLLDSLFMNSRPFSMERPLVEEDPFPDRRGLLNVYDGFPLRRRKVAAQWFMGRG